MSIFCAPAAASCRAIRPVVYAAICFVGPAVGAAEVAVSKASEQEPIDLFQAVHDGAVEAKVVVAGQFRARVKLTNPTRQVVAIRLPDVFAARPVLAQQNFFNPAGPQSTSNTQQPQSVAGPFQFNPNPGGNQNGISAVFNIPPESVREIRVRCFCVEHGKPNPKAIVPYELVPFSGLGGDPVLASVLKQYGRGDLDRDAVQAAVWHLANKKSWDELRRMSRPVALNMDEPIFTAAQLRAAHQLVDDARRCAASSDEGSQFGSPANSAAISTKERFAARLKTR